MSAVIRNAKIMQDGVWQEKDIYTKGGKIQKITDPGEEEEGNYFIDAAGLTALPGLIDIHVHLNEPGRTEWEGMSSGTRALAAGGVTTFFDMPLNSNPPTAEAERLLEKKAIAKEKSLINSCFWGALMPGKLQHIEELHEAGAIGFKAFMSRAGTPDFQHATDEVLLEGMQRIAEAGSRLAVHAESDTLTHYLTEKAAKEGRESMQDYEKTRPIEAEVEAVERIIRYAEWTGCPVHICHISSGAAAEAVKQAKVKGIAVTAETCAHYLYFTLEDAIELGPVAKCAPPLRTASEKEKLWKALEDGTLDLVSSDHSPAPPELKQDSVLKSWGGIAGAQQTIDVLLTEGVHRRGLKLEEIISWVSRKPAQQFGFTEKGELLSGYDADITLVDLEEKWTLQAGDLYQKHPQSPYIGEEFTGRTKLTMVNGQVVFDQINKRERR